MQYLNKRKQQLFYAIVKYLLDMSNSELQDVLVYIWALKNEEDLCGRKRKAPLI